MIQYKDYSMKILALIVPVFFVMLMSGCTSQDPAQIVEDALTRMNSLDSYMINYDYTMSIPPLINMNGNVTIYKKGELSRTDMSMPLMLGMNLVAKTYYLPEGTFVCTDLIGETTCTETDTNQMPFTEPGRVLKSVKDLIENGIIQLRFNGMGSIVGRSCYNISFDIDPSKFSMLDNDDLSDMGLDTTIMGDMEHIEGLDLSECYDSATGISLDTKMIMEVDMSNYTEGSMFEMGKIRMVMIVTATSFTPNDPIADSMFELPTEPTDLSDLTGGLNITDYYSAFEIPFGGTSCTVDEGITVLVSNTGTETLEKGDFDVASVDEVDVTGLLNNIKIDPGESRVILSDYDCGSNCDSGYHDVKLEVGSDSAHSVVYCY
jgi:hypothetical protein